MTAIYGVVGHPVGHSLSPRLHRAWITAAGLDAVYLPFDVGPAPDPQAVARAIRTLGIAGCNLTLPLKEGILPHLDVIAPEAAALGAVNTVVVREGVLTGLNTDAQGFLDGLAELGRPVQGLRAVVLGAGGAGRAVAAGLSGAGARVVLLNRTAGRARDVCAHLAAHGIAVEPGDLRDAPSRIADAKIVVCALSGPGAASVRAIDPSAVGPDAAWIDLNYWMSDPPLLAALRARGVAVQDGLPMLVHQGARAFEAFTGHAADPDLGRRALEAGGAR